MKNVESIYINSISKKLPKDYLIYKLRLSLNNDLYESGIISYEVFTHMQRFLIQKMDKIIEDYS